MLSAGSIHASLQAVHGQHTYTPRQASIHITFSQKLIAFGQVTSYVHSAVGHQQDPTIDSSRGQGRPPVPPKVSRGLPQKVVMGYQVG